MSWFRKLSVALCLLFVIFFLLGCANLGGGGDKKAALELDNAALQKLLPNKEGFHWVYNGFAEYGHMMDLERMEKKDSRINYLISGEVADMSDGESDRNFSLQMEYVIQDGVLTQKKEEELMLDSISSEIQLLKTPLKQGSQWKQTVTDEDGNKLNLDCKITDIKEENGIREYTIIYEDGESDYFERRKIREGTGVVSFEKMLTTGGESFVAGYTLNEEASGFKQPGG